MTVLPENADTERSQLHKGTLGWKKLHSPLEIFKMCHKALLSRRYDQAQMDVERIDEQESTWSFCRNAYAERSQLDEAPS
jgi:hypothetical protein